MLVVVAVFSILAIIFFFSSADVMTRTGVSRVHQDQRSIANALNEYRAENSDFPSTDKGLATLVSPSRLLSEIPVDPFGKERSRTYRYFRFPGNSNESYWVVASPGPDGKFEFPLPLEETMGGASSVGGEPSNALYHDGDGPDEIVRRLRELSYDPTNGTRSSGDIFLIDHAATASYR